MKHIIALHCLIVGILVTAALPANGQGNVTLGNRLSGSVAPVYGEDGVTKLAGPAFLARFYAGPGPQALLPVGKTEPFRTGGLGSGYVWAQVTSIPDAPNGTRIHVQMRAWAAASGDSYEEALAAGGPTGVSNVVPVVVTEPPLLPADLMGLESFALRQPGARLCA